MTKQEIIAMIADQILDEKIKKDKYVRNDDQVKASETRGDVENIDSIKLEDRYDVGVLRASIENSVEEKIDKLLATVDAKTPFKLDGDMYDRILNMIGQNALSGQITTIQHLEQNTFVVQATKVAMTEYNNKNLENIEQRANGTEERPVTYEDLVAPIREAQKQMGEENPFKAPPSVKFNELDAMSKHVMTQEELDKYAKIIKEMNVAAKKKNEEVSNEYAAKVHENKDEMSALFGEPETTKQDTTTEKSSIEEVAEISSPEIEEIGPLEEDIYEEVDFSRMAEEAPQREMTEAEKNESILGTTYTTAMNNIFMLLGNKVDENIPLSEEDHRHLGDSLVELYCAKGFTEGMADSLVVYFKELGEAGERYIKDGKLNLEYVDQLRHSGEFEGKSDEEITEKYADPEYYGYRDAEDLINYSKTLHFEQREIVPRMKHLLREAQEPRIDKNSLALMAQEIQEEITSSDEMLVESLGDLTFYYNKTEEVPLAREQFGKIIEATIDKIMDSDNAEDLLSELVNGNHFGAFSVAIESMAKYGMVVSSEKLGIFMEVIEKNGGIQEKCNPSKIQGALESLKKADKAVRVSEEVQRLDKTIEDFKKSKDKKGDSEKFLENMRDFYETTIPEEKKAEILPFIMEHADQFDKEQLRFFMAHKLAEFTNNPDISAHDEEIELMKSSVSQYLWRKTVKGTRDMLTPFLTEEELKEDIQYQSQMRLLNKLDKDIDNADLSVGFDRYLDDFLDKPNEPYDIKLFRMKNFLSHNAERLDETAFAAAAGKFAALQMEQRQNKPMTQEVAEQERRFVETFVRTMNTRMYKLDFDPTKALQVLSTNNGEYLDLVMSEAEGMRYTVSEQETNAYARVAKVYYNLDKQPEKASKDDKVIDAESYPINKGVSLMNPKGKDMDEGDER